MYAAAAVIMLAGCGEREQSDKAIMVGTEGVAEQKVISRAAVSLNFKTAKVLFTDGTTADFENEDRFVFAAPGDTVFVRRRDDMPVECVDLRFAGGGGKMLEDTVTRFRKAVKKSRTMSRGSGQVEAVRFDDNSFTVFIDKLLEVRMAEAGDTLVFKCKPFNGGFVSELDTIILKR
ncbi:MAG: hypothetical protein IJ482_00635 [Alphaproteobacteria bacterium]|nr:hypothetical protein [Alphaproteobacteria bacterium]